MAAACNLTFCVVGRDARQLAAARALQNSGYTVLGAEGAGQADYILLPMPMDAEAADLARILRAARPGTLALGGRISEPVRKAAQAAGVELVDYFLRPEAATGIGRAGDHCRPRAGTAGRSALRGAACRTADRVGTASAAL